MQYLVIKNRGEAPVEGFTILGVSTSRGREDRIGQFGSGLKHGILTCLRMGLNPLCWTGRTRLEFHTEPAWVGDTQYNKVFVKIGTKAPRELSMSLEFGALDWTGTEMALREFVSNALDAVDGDPSKVELRIMERPRPEEGSTLVCVPLTPDVQRYYNELGKHFLQFNPARKAMAKGDILPKENPGVTVVFRKGVKVREVQESGKPSLFDYNFGEELAIDEARNLNDYSVQSSTINKIARSARLGDVFNGVTKNPNCWEAGFGGWSLDYAAERHKEHWKECFAKTFGETAVVGMPDANVFNDTAVRKGYRVILMPTGWYTAMCKAGIPNALSKCEGIDAKGNEILDPSPEAISCLDRVWDWVELAGLTDGKDKPPVKLFRAIMKADSETMGYYKEGVVYMNVDYQTNCQTMLEELAHYITGETDMARGFQDYAFRLATAMATIAGG